MYVLTSVVEFVNYLNAIFSLPNIKINIDCEGIRSWEYKWPWKIKYEMTLLIATLEASSLEMFPFILICIQLSTPTKLNPLFSMLFESRPQSEHWIMRFLQFSSNFFIMQPGFACSGTFKHKIYLWVGIDINIIQNSPIYDQCQTHSYFGTALVTGLSGWY